MAKEISSFVEESGTVSSQLKPYNPRASLVTSIVTEGAERTAWGGHLCPPAELPAPRQVPGVLDFRPVGASVGAASGQGAASWWAAAGSMPAVTSPRGGGSRCPGSSVHAQVPRAEAEGGGLQGAAFLLFP